MDEQLKRELDLLLDLTAHPGWKVLMDETEQKLNGFRASAPFNMKNLEELYFARGVTATLMELMATRDKVLAALNQGEE